MVWDLSKIGDEQVRSCTCIAQSTHSLVYIIECGDAGSLHEDAWHLHGLTWECLAPLFKVDSNTAEILKPDGYLHDQAAVQYPERLHCSLSVCLHVQLAALSATVSADALRYP